MIYWKEIGFVTKYVYIKNIDCSQQNYNYFFSQPPPPNPPPPQKKQTK